jgi:hypothetical protein
VELPVGDDYFDVRVKGPTPGRFDGEDGLGEVADEVVEMVGEDVVETKRGRSEEPDEPGDVQYLAFTPSCFRCRPRCQQRQDGRPQLWGSR